MNIIQIQDALKDYSDDQLVREMQQPSGNAPQYLVLTELERRQKVRQRSQGQQKAGPTVAEEAVMSARPPARNSAIAEMMARPSPAAQPPQMRGGGVVKYQNKGYVPSSNLLRAIAMQESGMDSQARGAAGEVGMFQIMPTTAIQPGFGIPSLFPELEAQIGRGRKYASAREAYESNKDLVDEVLFNPSQSEQFAKSYLDTARSRFPDDEARAIAAWNVGMRGAEKLDDPSSFPYVQGVGSFAKSPDEERTPVYFPGISVAQASTGDQEEEGRGGIYGNVSFSNMIDSLADFFKTGDAQSGIGVLADQNRQKLIQSGLFKRAVDPSQMGDAEGQALIARRQQRIAEMEQQVAAMPNKAVIGVVIDQYLNDPDIAVRQRAQQMLDKVNEVSGQVSQAGGSPVEELADPSRDFDNVIPPVSSVATATPAEIDAQPPADDATDFLDPYVPTTTRSAGDEISRTTAEAMALDATDATDSEFPSVKELLMSIRDQQAQQVEKAREDQEFEKYLALAQMGAKLAEGKGPFIGAVGEAIGEGLPTLAASRKGLREAEKELIATDLSIAKVLADSAKSGQLSEYQANTLILSADSAINRARDDMRKVMESAAYVTADAEGKQSMLAPYESAINNLEAQKQAILLQSAQLSPALAYLGMGQTGGGQSSTGTTLEAVQAERATR